ncbi:MAG: 4-alpha-glucanotransferase [Treponema sp.]|jgi:4-alpha-glucanotransferase|nr:4-alpha-glucanotransferase [Treponema sp.]
MMQERAAGILLPVSSLPSPYGIGAFGEAAREWLRFLKAAGQKYWQILPLGPTGWGDSPYQSFSAFALSPYYIDIDILIEKGLLTREEVSTVRWGRRADKTDYAALYRRREPLLRKACERFKPDAAFNEFYSHNTFWLEDYCLFMALKKKNKGRSWLLWNERLRFRNNAVLTAERRRLAIDIQYHSFVQYMAYTQWMAIKEYARGLGIFIIGDMPIYVAIDSADTWANSEYFQLDENKRPIRVAGCPPDPFSAGGQLWGNPLYHWELMAQTGFTWWLSRLRLSLELYDVVRIDHFRGFESFYAIDASAHDARGGEWVKGPGLAFIDAVNRELPDAAIIAEDLGYLTPNVKAMLKASGYPGMKVLQFAFDSREASDYMPYTYGCNCVVYTGTHDNPTSLGWFKSARPEDVRMALDFFGIKTSREGNWAFIRCALASVADTAVIPMQDYLGLDNRARMNTPSTLGGDNWLWRMLDGAASPALAERIRRLAEVYGRR